MNIVDAGTRYGERCTVERHGAEVMKETYGTEWIYSHGTSIYCSTHPEFCKPAFENFLRAHNITTQPRPSLSSNTKGIVKRNNGVFEDILKRILLVARASSLINLFYGSAKLSAFQLARGYPLQKQAYQAAGFHETLWMHTFQPLHCVQYERQDL